MIPLAKEDNRAEIYIRNQTRDWKRRRRKELAETRKQSGREKKITDKDEILKGTRRVHMTDSTVKDIKTKNEKSKKKKRHIKKEKVIKD